MSTLVKSTANPCQTDPGAITVYCYSLRVSRSHSCFDGIDRFISLSSGALPFRLNRRGTTYALLFMFTSETDYTLDDVAVLMEKLSYFMHDVKIQQENKDYIKSCIAFFDTDEIYRDHYQTFGLQDFEMDYHDINQQLGQYQNILDKSRYSHLFHPDLTTTIRNLAGHLTYTQGPDVSVEDLEYLFKEELGWDYLFDTDGLEKMFYGVAKYIESHYDSTKQGPMTKNTFSWQIYKIDPEYLFVNNQNILRSEFQYMLYRITAGILKCGKNYIAWNRDYFNSFSDSYQKFTGRSLNNHKIPHITKVLEKYGYIRVKRRHNKSNLFMLGSKNPCFMHRK